MKDCTVCNNTGENSGVRWEWGMWKGESRSLRNCSMKNDTPHSSCLREKKCDPTMPVYCVRNCPFSLQKYEGFIIIIYFQLYGWFPWPFKPYSDSSMFLFTSYNICISFRWLVIVLIVAYFAPFHLVVGEKCQAVWAYIVYGLLLFYF